MNVFDKILAIIDEIDPAKFFWIYASVWAVLLILGYFLTGGFYTFMVACMLIASMIVVYKYKNPPITKNNSVFLIPLFGILYAGILHSGVLFQPTLITDKSQAQILTGVVPHEHEYVRGSGKGAKSYYYLNINGTRLHCDDDDYDDCELVYQYRGQNTTIYHYDGLAYEIDVDGQKIYEFHQQVHKFNDTQERKKQKMIWALILFGMPSVLFFFVNKRVIRDVEVISDDELNAIQHQQLRVQKLKSQQINARVGAGGWAWRILFGSLTVLTLVLVFAFLIIQKWLAGGVLFVLTAVFYYLSSLPRKNAKMEVKEYHQMLAEDDNIGELSEFLSVGFYNYMSVLSWVVMYVCCLMIWVLFVILMTYYGDFVRGILVLLMVIVMLILAIPVYLIIKRAIENRNFAFE